MSYVKLAITQLIANLAEVNIIFFVSFELELWSQTLPVSTFLKLLI